jgi:hypothetical protein
VNVRAAWLVGLALVLSLATVARAEPPETTQIEINYLLAHIESSGCEFYRNGSWYDGKRAQAHLRDKYEYLVGKNRIGTAEDFIEQAATESSLSGRPYKIRCGGGEPVPSNQWLREALARYRCFTATGVAECKAPDP